MKKLFTLAIAALAFFGASADDYTVYQNGALANGLQAWDWWASNFKFDSESPTNPSIKTLSIRSTVEEPTISMGIFSYNTGQLHSATLEFEWYATEPVNCWIRLTAEGRSQEDYKWTVSENEVNQWHKVSLPVAEFFPTVAQLWDENASNGEGYVFGTGFDKAANPTVVYYNNIVYKNIDLSWVAPQAPVLPVPESVPAIKQPKEDVFSVFSTYGNYNFSIGTWDQATRTETVSIAGNDVMKLTYFNYLGWVMESNPMDISEYTHMHVDYFPAEGGSFAFCPISLNPTVDQLWNAPEVKVGEWNSYDVPLSVFTANGCNLSAIKQMKYDVGYNNRYTGYIANVYFYKDDVQEPDPVVPGDGAVYSGNVAGSVTQLGLENVEVTYPYTLNYTIRYNEDKTLTVTGEYTFSEGEPFGVVPGSVFINNELNDFAIEGGKRVVTTTKTYNAGETLPIEFYLPAGNGAVIRDNFSYVVGSKNDSVNVETVVTPQNAPEYYTIQGVRVENPTNGLYIRVQNGRASKVIF